MIICVCNNITDRDLLKAVDQGLNRLADLRRELGLGAGCGTCEAYATQVLAAHHDSKSQFTEFSRPAPATLDVDCLH